MHKTLTLSFNVQHAHRSIWICASHKSGMSARKKWDYLLCFLVFINCSLASHSQKGRGSADACKSESLFWSNNQDSDSILIHNTTQQKCVHKGLFNISIVFCESLHCCSRKKHKLRQKLFWSISQSKAEYAHFLYSICPFASPTPPTCQGVLGLV